MKESEEYLRAVEALEDETMRLRTQAAEAEEEKVVVLKLNNDLKLKVSMHCYCENNLVSSLRESH